jgi:hypothetical protein
MYALVENRPGNPRLGEPFYIGIGNATRPRTHFTAAKYGRHYNVDVQKVIQRHLSVDVEPVVRTLVIGSSKYIAEIEQKAIALYGRRRVRHERGLLCNVSKGGDGADSDLMSDPEIVAKVGAATHARYQRPGEREAHSAKAKAAYASSELRARVGAATKVALAKPENRARLLAALKRIHSERTPEQYSEYAKKARDAHPERAEADRQRLIARQAAISADPVLAARRREIRSRDAKAAWADPIKRASRLEKMKGVKKTMTPAALAARAKAVDAMLAANGYSRVRKQTDADAVLVATRTVTQ